MFSQPVFDFGAHASANESTMANNTWVNRYEASHSLSSLSGPSQPTLDLNVGASVGKFSTVVDTLATEYEMLQILSTWSGPADPSQCTFYLGAGTFATESTTVDNTWVTGYEASQLLALSGPAEPIFNLDAGTSAADDDNELTAELKALLSPSAPSGGTNQFTPPKNGPRRRRRASSRQTLAIKSSSYPSIQREPTSFPSGSDSRQLMVAFNPFLPRDRTINVSDASALGPYPFSFRFNGLASAGNVSAPQPSTSVPGTIGGTSNSFNDAGTSNVSGGTTISVNKQAEATLSTQT